MTKLIVAAASVAVVGAAVAGNSDWHGADGAYLNDTANWVNWVDPSSDTHRMRNYPSLDYTVRLSDDMWLRYMTIDYDDLKVTMDLAPYTLRMFNANNAYYSIYLGKKNSELEVLSGHLSTLGTDESVTNAVYVTAPSWGSDFNSKIHVTGANTVVDGSLKITKGRKNEIRVDGGATVYGGLFVNDGNNVCIVSGACTTVNCLHPGSPNTTTELALDLQRGENATTEMEGSELRIVDHAVVTNAARVAIGYKYNTVVASRNARLLVSGGAHLHTIGVKDNYNTIGMGGGSYGHRLDVLDGGTASFNGACFFFGQGWNADDEHRTHDNTMTVAGEGSFVNLNCGDWDNSNFIGLGHTCGNRLFVTNNGVVQARSLDIGGYRKNGTRNLSMTNCFNRAYVADGGVLRAANFGVGAWCHSDCPPGPEALVTSNVVEIAKGGRYESYSVGSGSWDNYSFLRIGGFPTDRDNLFLVNGGFVTNQWNLRIGFNGASRNMLKITNGGLFFQGKDIQMASASVKGGENVIWIDNGGVMTNSSSLVVGKENADDRTSMSNLVFVGDGGELYNKGEIRFYGWGQRLVVSNGVLACSHYCSFPYDVNAKNGNCLLRFAGTHPRATFHIGRFNSGTRILFDLPPRGFTTIPLTVEGEWRYDDTVSVEVGGVERCAAAGGGTFTLVKGYNAATMQGVFTAERLARYNAALGNLARLYLDGQYLKLKIKRLGLLLLLR